MISPPKLTELPRLRKKGPDPYSAWMKYVVCLHLYTYPAKLRDSIRIRIGRPIRFDSIRK